MGKVEAADSAPGPGAEKKTENGVWLDAGDPVLRLVAADGTVVDGGVAVEYALWLAMRTIRLATATPGAGSGGGAFAIAGEDGKSKRAGVELCACAFASGELAFAASGERLTCAAVSGELTFAAFPGRV